MKCCIDASLKQVHAPALEQVISRFGLACPRSGPKHINSSRSFRLQAPQSHQLELTLLHLLDTQRALRDENALLATENRHLWVRQWTAVYRLAHYSRSRILQTPPLRHPSRILACRKCSISQLLTSWLAGQTGGMILTTGSRVTGQYRQNLAKTRIQHRWIYCNKARLSRQPLLLSQACPVELCGKTGGPFISIHG